MNISGGMLTPLAGLNLAQIRSVELNAPPASAPQH